MEIFRKIAGTACFLGIVITIFSSLYPSEKFAKQMKIIFSLIFILSVVKPFLAGRIDIPEINGTVAASTEKYEAMNEEAYYYFISSVESNISASLETALNEIGIYPVKIETSINISDSGGISINEVRLFLENEDKADEARECILGILASDVNVKIFTDSSMQSEQKFSEEESE